MPLGWLVVKPVVAFVPVDAAELVAGRSGAVVAAAVELQLVAAHCVELATELVAVHVPVSVRSDGFAAGLVVGGESG